MLFCVVHRVAFVQQSSDVTVEIRCAFEIAALISNVWIDGGVPRDQRCGQTDWKAAALCGVGKITVTSSAVCLVNRKARRQEHINDAKTQSAIEIAAV